MRIGDYLVSDLSPSRQHGSPYVGTEIHVWFCGDECGCHQIEVVRIYQSVGWGGQTRFRAGAGPFHSDFESVSLCEMRELQARFEARHPQEKWTTEDPVRTAAVAAHLPEAELGS